MWSIWCSPIPYRLWNPLFMYREFEEKNKLYEFISMGWTVLVKRIGDQNWTKRTGPERPNQRISLSNQGPRRAWVDRRNQFEAKNACEDKTDWRTKVPTLRWTTPLQRDCGWRLNASTSRCLWGRRLRRLLKAGTDIGVSFHIMSIWIIIFTNRHTIPSKIFPQTVYATLEVGIPEKTTHSPQSRNISLIMPHQVSEDRRWQRI